MKSIIEAIESLFNFLFEPLHAIRFFEDRSWWGANFLNFVFIITGFLSMVYWMRQLKKFDDNNEEDRSSTSHSYL